MLNNCIKNSLSLLLVGFIFWGCTRDDTKYYADGEDKGLAIFSNTYNNILSCYINDKPWRTFSRVLTGFTPRMHNEVEITRQPATTSKDTLIIQWHGYFETNQRNTADIRLHLALPAHATINDLNALQGKRLIIDSTINGFFEINDAGINPANIKANGHLYFNIASFNSIAPNTYTGDISGLFDADFSSVKITKGRFDHFISPEQIQF